jgi:hypothetical protein
LKVENLIEVSLRSRRECQIIEYSSAEHAANRRNIKVDELYDLKKEKKKIEEREIR